jgi:rubrerythrin
MEDMKMPQVNEKFMDFLYLDLRNERKHMMFYLTNASSIKGLDSIEYIEMFENEAKEEMSHVISFQDMIVGLGGDLNCLQAQGYERYEIFQIPYAALKYALEMEEEVVDNYVERIEMAANLENKTTAKWLEVFYEKQIEKSRADVDKYKRLLNY